MTERGSRSIRFVAMACVVLGWPDLARSAEPEAIPWRQDLRQAQEEARARHLPLWVQFTGPWCHFCERMEQESFVHPRVVGRARSAFVPVKLRSDVHEDLALRFNLTGLPATILMKPSGEEIGRQEGYLDPDAFDAFLRGTLARHGLLAREAPRAPEPGVALAGYCPVSLVEGHRLVPGQDGVSLVHEGRVYRFANPGVRAAFQRKPEQFIPVNGGRCPVAQVDVGESRRGDPRFSVLYQGHLYVCDSEASRQRFLKRPERYAYVDAADRGFCPHCWTREGLLVRGIPRYSLTRSDRRYCFPDPAHLEAFRASPEVSRR